MRAENASQSMGFILRERTIRIRSGSKALASIERERFLAFLMTECMKGTTIGTGFFPECALEDWATLTRLNFRSKTGRKYNAIERENAVETGTRK